MKREIEFRGWSYDYVEWVYGYYTKAGDEAFIDAKADGGYYAVDPESVEEWTGATDSDGRKIYENDVVRMTTTSPGDLGERIQVEGTVVYGGCMWWVDAGKEGAIPLFNETACVRVLGRWSGEVRQM